MNRKIRIGSRGSELALWQANFFQGQLDSIGIDSEIIIIKTKGDQIQHLSFDKIEGKGFFTKEIEEKLILEEIDVAIHSHKDLETKNPAGLTVAAVSYRENPAEMLLTRTACIDLSLPLQFKKNAIIGTSSARRKAQILALRPDITIKDIRGNVPTRVNKLRNGEFDAILLAAAGVNRLQLKLHDLHIQILDPALFIPAPAQGVLAYQTRANDQELIDILQQLNHPDVKNAIDIEREILSGFGGGCHIPIGVFAEPNNDGFRVRVTYADSWEHFSNRVRFEAKNAKDALHIFNELKNKALPKSLFISRKLNSESFLDRACIAHNIQLTDESLISTKAIHAHLPTQEFDWIFFASSNAVTHFLDQFGKEILSHKKLAAYGSGTAATLGNYTNQIHFIGGDGSPASVASTFARVVNDGVVLFPISDISRKNIQKMFDEHQIINLVVYSTEPLSKQVSEHDVYCFTSPSNVAAFFNAKNTLSDNCKILAIGTSTAAELNSRGITCLVAEQPNEAEIFSLLG